ncbi:MAG: FecR family protein [Tannerella sp.]|nr:FecR family protein [Tannerella sp.]
MDEQTEKYFNGQLTLAERVELLRKAETDAALRAEMIQIQSIEALICLMPKKGDENQAKADYQNFIASRAKIIRMKTIRRRLLYAAAAACIASVTWFSASRFYSSDKQQVTAPVAKNVTISVPKGQRLAFRLEDSTTVWINSLSSLTFPAFFADNERRVKIEGEAYFEVAKDAVRPFIVRAGKMDVQALGTEFNISAYPEEKIHQISLIKGKALVFNPLRPSVNVELHHDEKVLVNYNVGSLVKDSIGNKHYFLWREGIYSFENERFEVILKRLELYYDITIEVKNKKMLNWRYTVKFRQRDSIDEIMQLMRKIHRFSLIKDEENNKIIINI